jgi:hypothetical protein
VRFLYREKKVTAEERIYVLDEDKSPVPTTDIKKFAELINNIEARRVDLTELDRFRVSTVFLCTDHNYTGEGGPILFETMVFDREHGGAVSLNSLLNKEEPDIMPPAMKMMDIFMRSLQARYRTWDEARNGHQQIVNVLSQLIAKEVTRGGSEGKHEAEEGKNKEQEQG